MALKGGVIVDEMKKLHGWGFGEGGDPKTVGRQFSVTVDQFHLPFLNINRSIVIIRKMK